MLSRPLRALCLAVTAGVLLSGCDPVSEPLVKRQAGYRVAADGALSVTTWGSCRQVKRVRFRLERDTGAGQVLGRWVIESTGGARPLPDVTFGRPPAGFVTARRSGVADWRSADSLWVYVNPGRRQIVDYVDLDAMRADPADGADQWYVTGEGWLTEPDFRELAAEDERIALMCGPSGL